MIVILLLSVLALGIMGTIFQMVRSRQANHEQGLLIRARDNLNAHLRGVMTSAYFYQANFLGPLAPLNNTQLRDCIASPSVTTECTSDLSLPFESPFTNQRWIGSREEPARYDNHGSFCSLDEATNCQFNAFSSCIVSCPDDQFACPFVKVISCEFFLENSSFLNLNAKKSLGTRVLNPRFSLRLNRDDVYQVTLE